MPALPLGKLRGKALASYVLAKAHDGYQVVFTLGEIDAGIRQRADLVADKRDGKAAVRISGAVPAWSVPMIRRARAPCGCWKRWSLFGCRNKDAAWRSDLALFATCFSFAIGFPLADHLRRPATSGICPRLSVPYVPADNPMTAAKVELGRYLFYDTRMSVNGKASCATCHKQELAFTDGRAVGLGATGESHSRSAMSLVNVAWSGALTWSNPEMKSLEKQALVPMFGDHPVELGLREGDGFLPMLRSDPTIPRLVRRAFPGDADPLHDQKCHQGARQLRKKHCLRAFALRSLSLLGDDDAHFRFREARRDLCSSTSICPASAATADSISPIPLFPSETPSAPSSFTIPGSTTSWPALLSGAQRRNLRVHEVPGDVGKFKAPTLRNIALTAPYMHDGSIATLEGVLDHYAAGGRSHDNPNKDPLIGGFVLSQHDRDDLIAFLKSLTDEMVIRDPRFANPWPDRK